MKRFFTILSLVLVTFGAFATPSFAATFAAGDSYALRADETIKDDLYIAGGSATLVGNVEGDLLTGAFNIFVNDNVSQNAFLLGGTTDVLGSVGKTLHILSWKTLIHGNVGGDIVVASESLSILPGTNVLGNIFFEAGNATIEGTTTGDIQGNGGDVVLNGAVLGSVQVTANTLKVGPDAVINGMLDYSSQTSAQIDQNATISGKVTYTKVDTRSKAERLLPTLWGTWIIIKFVVLLLSALVIQGVFRSITPIFVRTAIDDPLWSLLRGFLLVIGVPLAGVLILLTFVGIPFVVLGGALYVAFLVLAYLFSPIIAGAYLYQFLQKPYVLEVHWKSIVLGVVAVMIFAPLGIFGTIIQGLLFLLSLGAIYHVLFERFVHARK